MERIGENISDRLDPQDAAFRLVAVLYGRGSINDETMKNVKDLERAKIAESTSLNNQGN